MTAWSDIVLYEISEGPPSVNELAEFEPILAINAPYDDHERVKEHIAFDINTRFGYISGQIEQIHGEGTDKLDYIINPQIFNRPSIYYALYLYFNARKVSEQDEFAHKADHYLKLYEQSFDSSSKNIIWDIPNNKNITRFVR